MQEMLTVIVPVYKVNEEFLRYCIESLLNQGRTDYRIILVDDGSSDNCGQICDEYAAMNSIISVIHQENQGVSVARNNAIKKTETKWLSFVDADDWVENDYIDTIYNYLDTLSKTNDMVLFEYAREYKNNSCHEGFGKSTGQLKDVEIVTCQEATYYKHIKDGKLNPYSIIAIWNKVYRVEFLKNNRLLFDPSIHKGEDRILNFWAFQKTNSIGYIKKCLYHYRCWEDSTVNKYNPNIIQQTEAELYALKRAVRDANLGNGVEEKVNCRICTRMYSCLRLFYFHEDFHGKLKEQIRLVKELAQIDLYSHAIRNVKLSLLSTQEKIFVICMKKGFYYSLYLLVRLKSRATSKKLN